MRIPRAPGNAAPRHLPPAVAALPNVPAAAATPAPAGVQPVLFPVEVVPPAGFVDVVAGGSAVSPGGAATVVIPAARIVVSAGYGLMLKSLEFYVRDLADASAIAFSVLRNNVPVPGFGNIPMFARVASSVSVGFDLFLRGKPGDVFDFALVQEAGDAAQYAFGVLTNGYLYPIRRDT